MKTKVGYNLDYMPEKSCNDENCPYHGSISVRGKTFRGKVVSDAMNKTVKVTWENLVKHPKYMRYFKVSSSVLAHNPECLDAKVGDEVLIGETRPISKRKHFVVLRVLKKNESN